MPRRFVTAGSASQSVNVFLQDRTSGDGVINMTTANVKVTYKIGTTGAFTTVPLVGANTSDAWTASGTTHGWAQVSSVNMPGIYRLDVPDASIASTPDVTYFVHCSTPGANFIPVALNLQVISSGGSDLPSDVILYKGMAQTSVNIGTMLTSVNSKVTSIDSVLSSVNAKVTSVDSRLSSMDTMLSSVNAKVTSVDSRLSSMDTMLSSVNAKVTSVDTKVTSINTVLTSVNTQVTSILANVTSIDSRLSSMDTMLTSVNAHVTSVDSRLTSMDTMLSSVNAKVTSIDTKVSSMNTQVTSILSNVTSIEANTTALVVGVVVASIANNAITAAAIAANALTTTEIASGVFTQISDNLLDRDMSVGTDSGSSAVRTPRQALRFLRNKWAIAGTTLTVYKEDDTAASWSAELTTNASADPISAVDPA
jgi:archaellum component FlaC